MTAIRENFQKWLISQGYPSKGITGKNSTVYDYLRYIDKMLKSLFETDSWQPLIDEFPSILLFYLLTGKIKYRQNLVPFDDINQLAKRSKEFYIAPDLLNQFRIYKDKEPFFMQKLHNLNENKKTGAAISKFYHFLFETQSISSYSFEDFTLLAEKIVACCIYINRAIETSETANSPKEIKSKNNNNEKNISLKELAQFLECSIQNAVRLLKDRNIELSVASINQYLREHYHPSTNSKIKDLNIFSVEWCTMDEAATKLLSRIF
ncbi:MAG: hypothetical protein IJ660_01985 [Alphaproteobacteria bacterium]|nr:hypothetical protein [Alphaproteobacteria bacterium]